MPISAQRVILPAQTGRALHLNTGEVLRIIAVEAQQVADLALFRWDDLRDGFSPGRTIDYNERITVKRGDVLYSAESVALAEIVEDDVGVHDMLLAPCSEAMFERRGEPAHPSCHANIASAVREFGIEPPRVTATLNVFMDVRVSPGGALTIHPPRSQSGDAFAIRACCELLAALTACSSELTNNGRCKRIAFEHTVAERDRG